MDKENYPIIAKGELYANAIKRKYGGGKKIRPNIYNESKVRLISNIDRVLETIREEEEVFFSEKILCVRMEPKFEAKSYVPNSLANKEENMKFVGGRKYTHINKEGETVPAKLYFLKTGDSGILDLKETLSTGEKDDVESWREQICSIHAIDLLNTTEKFLGFSSEWDRGTVEFVLHPIMDEYEKVIDKFYDLSKIPVEKTQVRKYEDGLTFISAICGKKNIEGIQKLNPLRAIHPLGKIRVENIRLATSDNAPKSPFVNEKSSIVVGVFDGGVDESIPLLNGFVKAYDCVESDPEGESIEHGNGVCGTVLFGNLAGKNKNDILEPPCVSVDCFRILPLKNENDFELYEAIDAIETIVSGRKDIKLFNLSLGPEGAIVEDSINRFTYAIDNLTYSVDEGELNPLFCIAVGNDGDLDSPMNRIQSPSDAVNALGVGAYTYDYDGKRIRAEYSCIGAGREGAKIKPDFLEFGGSIDRPFVLVGSEPNKLATATGTSFSSPLAAHKIGKLMAHSEDVCPHLGRTLLIHNAEILSEFSQDEQGYGFTLESLEEILYCDEKRVTILYSGTLEPSQIVRLPIYAPRINEFTGMVDISWTITTIVDPFMNDPDAYTNNCIHDSFIPHNTTFRFSKIGEKDRILNMSKPENAVISAELINKGYRQSAYPVSKSSNKYWEEAKLRATDLKWDTVIKKCSRKRSSSLLDPALMLHAMGRNGFQSSSFKYYAVVTINAPQYDGNLYNTILQRYRNLAQLEIRNTNRIMVRAE